MDYPVTPAIRFLRDRPIEFVPRLYDYVEKGGTGESARQLGVDEHAVVKTLIFETNEKKPLIVLMHGDRQVSAKNLARHIGVKSVEPATPERDLNGQAISLGAHRHLVRELRWRFMSRRRSLIWTRSISTAGNAGFWSRSNRVF